MRRPAFSLRGTRSSIRRAHVSDASGGDCAEQARSRRVTFHPYKDTNGAGPVGREPGEIEVTW
jgi:hypothetical protein